MPKDSRSKWITYYYQPARYVINISKLCLLPDMHSLFCQMSSLATVRPQARQVIDGCMLYDGRYILPTYIVYNDGSIVVIRNTKM